MKSYLIWSVVKWNKVKWSERSKVKWNEAKWSAIKGRGGDESLWERFIGVGSDEKWRTGTPRLHCLLSSHWPSFRFLSFMSFLIPSIQFFFGLPRPVFCFGIHFNISAFTSSELMIGWKKKKSITRNCTQYCLAWVFLPFCTCCKVLICLVRFVASFKLSCV